MQSGLIIGGNFGDTLQQLITKSIMFFVSFSLLFGYFPDKYGVYKMLNLTKLSKAANYLLYLDSIAFGVLLVLTIFCFSDFWIWRYIAEIEYVNGIIIILFAITLLIAIGGYFVIQYYKTKLASMSTTSKTVLKETQKMLPSFVKKYVLGWFQKVWAFCYFMWTALFGFGLFRLFFGCSSSVSSSWTIIVYIMLIVLFYTLGSRGGDDDAEESKDK
jgi:hypothetical protein